MVKRKYSEDQIYGPPPKEPGLMSKIGSGALSGISAVANTLDLPGSSVRDFLAGKNPLDQWASPFSADNRVTGRDLLRQYDMVGKKDTWGNWAGGFAAEIFTDPLLPFSFGKAAIGGAGKLVKSAGLFDDIGRIASKAPGKGLGGVGMREARLSMTPQKLIDLGGPEIAMKLKDTAGRTGVNLDDVLNEPLGGMAKNWMTGSVLGTGETAQKVARGMDYAGDLVRNWKIPGTDVRPVADIANLFNKKAFNATSRATAQTGEKLFTDKEAVRAAVRQPIARAAHILKQHGWGGDDMSNQVLEWFEFPQSAPPEMRGVVDEIRGLMDSLPDEFADIGGILGDANKKIRAAGSEAAYFPQFATENVVGRGNRGREAFSGYTSSSKARWEWTHGAKLGRSGLRQAEIGPAVQQMMDEGLDKDQMADALRDILQDQLPDEFIDDAQKELLKKMKMPQTVQGANDVLADAMAAGDNSLAREIAPKSTWKEAIDDITALSPELRKSGIWGNHPLTDALHKITASHDALVSMKAVMNHLVDMYKSSPPSLAGGAGKTSLQDLLVSNSFTGNKGLGMNVGDRKAGAAQWFWKQLGIDLSTMSNKQAKPYIRQFREMAVDQDTAKFLLQANEGWGAPQTVSSLAGLWDSWNNLTKALFTSAKPSFHGRNLPAGQFNNIIADQFSAKHVKAGLDVVSGGVSSVYRDIPLVREELAKRGISNPTDQEATDFVKELAYAWEMTGGSGTAIPTHAQHVGGSINDILSEVPGDQPFKLGDVASKLFGRKGTTWNPFRGRVRGVMEATDSTFAPVAAGEVVGNAIEHMNRFPAFTALLEQGIDPAEAAKRVLEAQVGYQNRFYTATERDVMQRMMLFYKFFRGQVPFTIKQLAENPAGRLSQTLRAINRSREDDELTPQWVKETASIPIGTQPDGSERYVTGIGLPFEDPIQFATPSLQSGGIEALSRLNPVLKAPLEYFTGQSFFQKGGPHGEGRPLGDLDPALGRTLANIGNLTGLRDKKTPVRWPGSGIMEHVLSNSPAATAINMARTASDPRKGVGAKAANLTTGLKFTDISPAAQDKELMNRVAQIEKQLGGRTYQLSYIPKDVKEEMSAKELKQVEQINTLKRLLEARSRGRRERKQ